MKIKIEFRQNKGEKNCKVHVVHSCPCVCDTHLCHFNVEATNKTKRIPQNIAIDVGPHIAKSK